MRTFTHTTNFLGHIPNTPESLQNFAEIRKNLRKHGICVRLRGRMTNRRAKSQAAGMPLDYRDVNMKLASECWGWAIYVRPKREKRSNSLMSNPLPQVSNEYITL